MSRIYTIMVFLFLAWSVQSQSVAPSVLASSGGEGQSGGTSVEWTLGELAISSLEQGDNILTQGFHQPNLIITGTKGQVDIGLSLYPNPTHQWLVLEHDATTSYDYKLHSIQGQQAMNGEIVSGQNILDLTHLPSGHYILTVLSQDEILQSFKIEKTGL